MFIGFYLDDKSEDFVGLETTLIGTPDADLPDGEADDEPEALAGCGTN